MWPEDDPAGTQPWDDPRRRLEPDERYQPDTPVSGAEDAEDRPDVDF